jgi:orotidine-5'-phosphate decarboxylase
MNARQLFDNIKAKRSYLCVGLDTDYFKLPKFLLDKEYPVFEFNKHIINTVARYVVACKLNLAFYETLGAAGWISLELTVNYIKENHPDIFLIADAKRGDIGNSSKMYVRSFFKNLDFDAITISPYMGRDSVEPFFEVEDKWAIILALTSNEGASDFQYITDKENDTMLYEQVITKSKEWGNIGNTMYVVGATKAKTLQHIRKLIPNHFLLVPGVGAQGGSLEEVAEYGMNKQCGLLVNSSRGIIYADGTDRFAMKAEEKASEIQLQMQDTLKKKGII